MQQFEKVQLKIFYYFMLADGKCTEGEKKMFDSICSTLNIKAEEKNEIVSICELAVTEQSRDNSEGIIQIIKNLCQEETGSFLRRTVKEKIRNDWKLKKGMLWDLINLGYADKEYSEPEDKVISFLAQYWVVDKNVVEAMLDTAETMLATVKLKEWAKISGKSYDEISAIVKEADEDLLKLEENIRIIIGE